MSNVVLFGANGQVGSYQAEILIEKGYDVIGVTRRTANSNLENLQNVINHKSFHLVSGDITDYSSVQFLVNIYQPTMIFNQSAMSNVGESFKSPIATIEIDTIGVLNILEVVRKCKPDTKYYQASTSELYGKNYSERKIGYISRIDSATGLTSDGKKLPPEEWSQKFTFPEGTNGGMLEKYQDENTPFKPCSPYGAAKLAAHELCRIYRQSYNLFISCGITFNMESERRGKDFVTRKITDYVGKLYSVMNGSNHFESGNYSTLKLGNILAYRDWMFVRDAALAQVKILELDKPDDFVLCSEETHTVEEFLDIAFSYIGLDYKEWIEIDPQFYRPLEVDYLRGDCSKAKKVLGWKTTTTFKELVESMVIADIKRYS